MSAPNRAEIVAAVVGQHPEFTAKNLDGTYVQPDRDVAKAALLPFVIRALNVGDGGVWGYLKKMDQGGKIPNDIAVWKPTMEHFDVLSDSGPVWAPKGVVPDADWVWYPVDGVEPNPIPDPDGALAGRVMELEAEVVRLILTNKEQATENRRLDEELRYLRNHINAVAGEVSNRVLQMEERLGKLHARGRIAGFLNADLPVVVVE